MAQRLASLYALYLNIDFADLYFRLLRFRLVTQSSAFADYIYIYPLLRCSKTDLRLMMLSHIATSLQIITSHILQHPLCLHVRQVYSTPIRHLVPTMTPQL